MPGLTGLELCEKIRNNEGNKEKPVLVLSSDNDKSLRDRSKNLDALWLVKPMNPESLLNVVNKIQENHSQ